MKNEKVVITGLGMISGSGLSVEEYIKKLEFRPVDITRYSLDGLKCHKAFEISQDFNIKEFTKKISIIRKERISQIVVAACIEACRDANLEGCLPSDRIGSILSTEYGPTNTVLSYLEQLDERGPGDVSANLFTQTVYNVASGQAALQLQMRGVSSTVVGCSSVSYAYDLIRDDKADVVFAVGVDELNSAVHSRCEYLGVMCAENEFILGEGCGVIVLEKESFARERHAKVYAEIFDYVRLSISGMAKEYIEFNEDDKGIFYKLLTKLLKRNKLVINDISNYNMVANGIKNIDAAEHASLDLLGYKNNRNIPKRKFGEAFGANECFSIIESILNKENRGYLLVGTLYLNGNAGLCGIEKG